ncbi:MULTISPECIES: restriction endonuclease subunit S [unclassified Endozoicomonas]|uniref:restriction endonuclease subunit S n=1 Tax=unclassified Endozoicomonas TaxID=2644528 RepID=UPI003BB58636
MPTVVKNSSPEHQIALSEVVSIQAGYPFRGAITKVANGYVRVVQAKDISDLGELSTENLITTELTGKRKADWLQQGDILFIAKGGRYIASYIADEMPQVTLAPSLFLLRVNSACKGRVNPEFLTWQLNQSPVQRYFRNSAEGSHQVNIRKPVLAETAVTLPDLTTQNTIAKLYRASIKENALLQRLIVNRQQQLSIIANDLITKA